MFKIIMQDIDIIVAPEEDKEFQVKFVRTSRLAW